MGETSTKIHDTGAAAPMLTAAGAHQLQLDALHEMLRWPGTYVERRVDRILDLGATHERWECLQQILVPAVADPLWRAADTPQPVVVSLGIFKKNRLPDLRAFAHDGSALSIMTRQQQSDWLASALLERFLTEDVPEETRIEAGGIAAAVFNAKPTETAALLEQYGQCWEAAGTEVDQATLDEQLRLLRTFQSHTHVLAWAIPDPSGRVMVKMTFTQETTYPYFEAIWNNRQAVPTRSLIWQAIRLALMDLCLLPVPIRPSLSGANHSHSFYLLVSTPAGVEVDLAYWRQSSARQGAIEEAAPDGVPFAAPQADAPGPAESVQASVSPDSDGHDPQPAGRVEDNREEDPRPNGDDRTAGTPTIDGYGGHQSESTVLACYHQAHDMKPGDCSVDLRLHGPGLRFVWLLVGAVVAATWLILSKNPTGTQLEDLSPALSVVPGAILAVLSERSSELTKHMSRWLQRLLLLLSILAIVTGLALTADYLNEDGVTARVDDGFLLRSSLGLGGFLLVVLTAIAWGRHRRLLFVGLTLVAAATLPQIPWLEEWRDEWPMEAWLGYLATSIVIALVALGIARAVSVWTVQSAEMRTKDAAYWTFSDVKPVVIRRRREAVVWAVSAIAFGVVIACAA